MKPAPPSGWFLDQPGGKYRTLNRLKTSTGPRSLERGESGDLRALQHPHLASTRPRSPERGEVFFWGGLLGCRVASTGPRSPERGEFYTGFEVNEHFVGLQRGHAHLSVESALLLIPLVQVRNTSIATASAFSSAPVLVMSNCLVIINLFWAVTLCERRRGFCHHLAARGLSCQRSA